MNWLRREAKASTAEIDHLATEMDQAIKVGMKAFGHSVVSLIHPDILDHAADTVTSLRAKTVEEKTKVEARLSELKAESLGLLENHRRCVAVLGMVEKGLRDLEAATDKPDAQKAPTAIVEPAPGPADPATADMVVAAALAPAAE